MTGWSPSPGNGRWIKLTGSPISRPLSTVRIYSSRCTAIEFHAIALAQLPMKVTPFASFAGCMNRTSHPCGSSGSIVVLFRPGGTAAPEASRYRFASKRMNNSMAPGDDGTKPRWLAIRLTHSLTTQIRQWQTTQCPINSMGSKSNPVAGSLAVANLRQSNAPQKIARQFLTCDSRLVPIYAQPL